MRGGRLSAGGGGKGLLTVYLVMHVLLRLVRPNGNACLKDGQQKVGAMHRVRFEDRWWLVLQIRTTNKNTWKK